MQKYFRAAAAVLAVGIMYNTAASGLANTPVAYQGLEDRVAQLVPSRGEILSRAFDMIHNGAIDGKLCETNGQVGKQ